MCVSILHAAPIQISVEVHSQPLHDLFQRPFQAIPIRLARGQKWREYEFSCEDVGGRPMLDDSTDVSPRGGDLYATCSGKLVDGHRFSCETLEGAPEMISWSRLVVLFTITPEHVRSPCLLDEVTDATVRRIATDAMLVDGGGKWASPL